MCDIYGYSNPQEADDLIDLATGNLPLEIVEATASLAAKYVLIDKGIFMSSGATSINQDGVSKNYGEMPYLGLIKYLDQTAQNLLKRHKKMMV